MTASTRPHWLPQQLCAVLFAAAYACSAAALAQTLPGPVITTPQVRAELLAHAPDGVGPGKTVWLGLQLAHQPDWHTYWKNPGDSGLPTMLQWTLPSGVSAGEIAWPLPKKYRWATWPTMATKARCCCRCR